MAPSSTDSNYSSASAPLPSPSSSQPQNGVYFPSNPPYRHRSTNSLHTSQPQSQQHTQQSQQQLAQAQQQQYSHDPYGPGTNTKEKDFCLIAEAAKRAQMACLMRDMGEVAL